MSKAGLRKLIPLLHFILTFTFERIIFKFSWNSIEFMIGDPKNYYIGDKTEMVMTYVLSKVFAIILIILFWNLVFYIIDGKIEKDILRLFTCVFIIGLIIGVFLYPNIIFGEIDNYAAFALAIRFLPYYWHSIFTSTLYAGCMMIIPHPIAIFIVQWSIAVFVIAYIYTGISEITNGNKIKYVCLLFFILPDSYELIFNAYRNNYFTLLCLAYFAFIFFAFTKGRKLAVKEILIVAAYSAFLMVWRSEGIIVGLGGMAFLLLFCIDKTKKNIFSAVIVLMVGFMVFHSVQGIGAKKYYGKDYMIINTTNVIKNILNNPNANLSYEGVEEDLVNIEKIIPAQVIKELGMDGYRQYNYSMGRLDGNQSFASDEDAENYVSSYYNLVFHNIGSYVNRQIYTFCECMGIAFKPELYAYEAERVISLPQYDFYQRDYGQDEYNKDYCNSGWSKNKFRVAVSSVISKVITLWQDLATNSHFNTLIKALSLLGLIRLCLHEIYQFVKRRKYNFYFLFMSLIVLGEVCSIMLFAPEGRLSYMFPMIYVCYFMIYIRMIQGE